MYCVFYGLACAVIGMAAKVLLPNLDNVNNAFAAVIQVALPDGIRSLVITAAMAAMMSTASAGLLAASSTLSEDLLPRIRGGKASGLGITRICTLITGVLVLIVGLVVSDVLSALTLAYNLLVGGMLIPLIGAIFWKRATPAGAHDQHDPGMRHRPRLHGEGRHRRQYADLLQPRDRTRELRSGEPVFTAVDRRGKRRAG